MKKVFIVEVDYEELEENVLKNADVFYDAALENAIEELMYRYKATNSIKGDYFVRVKEIK